MKNSMTKMRYRSPSRLGAFLLITAVSVGVVFAAYGWYTVARAAYLTPAQEVEVPMAGAQEIAVSNDAREQYGIDSAARALDASGQATGYVVVTTMQGYKSAIRVQSTFAADGKTLASMRVLSQDETAYLGSRVQTAEFSMLFDGRRAPMKLWGSASLGSPIDALSGATISSKAVVDAVNNAYYFLQSIAVT